MLTNAIKALLSDLQATGPAMSNRSNTNIESNALFHADSVTFLGKKYYVKNKTISNFNEGRAEIGEKANGKINSNV